MPTNSAKPESYRSGPDETGHFGMFGGRFVAETLMPLILEVEEAYNQAQIDPSFQSDFDFFAEHYIGRPSPLYFAESLTQELGGARIYFKRDELNHTGAHKINNTLGQILLARRMGKKTHYRGNRRRTTWRCNRYSLCSFRSTLCRLHGINRHRTPGTQRFQNEITGSRGNPGGERNSDSQRRNE
jgi:hypothetical protein